ncbi:beta-ketoacyl-ACP synthase III [Candidatus Ruminimicrobiellum ovillum]|uniref:beta-ketoacyl-ACP synthase III n=1 Tax=Candidatus Ruminimicrobiellum ovillum TaxID=1947927 RepID=UPI003559EA4D
MDKKIGVKILSSGSYVPEKVLTNFDLEKMVETSDEWISTRTGIKERRILDKNQTTSDLAYNAAVNAIEKAKISVDDIDLIILATISPDAPMPSTACYLQKKLKAFNAVAFDISAACSGFIYGVSIAKAFISSGMYKRILLVGVEALSRVTDWTDRNTCVLFGDGAGAMIFEASETENDIVSTYLGTDGTHTDILNIPAGGSAMPATKETVEQRLHFVKMLGKEVFKVAVSKMALAVNKAQELVGLTDNDIDLYIPHQANIRIIEAVAKKAGVTKEKVYVNVHKYGNMSAATTIVALDEAYQEGRIKKGNLVELVAFGAGLTWGACILKINF